MTRLVAPMTGWLAPLDEVPDEVFSGRMMGDGFAVDPIDGLVAAPCAGVVQALAPTGHSVTIAADDGATILIHVGLETVALGGEGFAVLTRVGTRVAAGDLLLRFDLDRVARRAKSLLSPVIAIGEGDSIIVERTGCPVAIGDEVAVASGTAPAPTATGGGVVERDVVVPLAHGLHARPAARIVATLKPFAAEVLLSRDARTSSARSIVALMTLAAKQGDRLVVHATGPDAAAAADAIVSLIASGMGEAQAAVPPPTVVAPPSPPGSNSRIAGITAAPGIAIGPACHLAAVEIVVPVDGNDVAAERRALVAVLTDLRATIGAGARGAAADIAAAHLALLDDPELTCQAETSIAAGRGAGHAWRGATRAAAAALCATGDPLLIERAADLADLERRVLEGLTGAAAAPPAMPPGAILLAADLLPSQFMALDAARLAGICTAGGGPTSHVAILAAAAGVPMLVAAGATVEQVPDGRTLVLDATGGWLETDPGTALLAETERCLAQARRARAAATAAAGEDARTADGTRIEIFANLGSVADAARAVAAGAEGCGLLRTEFLFLDRDRAPTEDEQARDYAAIAATLGERPLIVRTLDIGGDKPVPYLQMATEDNPALGLRGVRLTLARLDLLDTQLRAILRGVPAGQCRIMVPMVIEAAELRAVRSRLDAARAALGITAAIPLGVMIETPAAALLAASIAREADFLSIGSNDLTQYALACDRGNPATAARVDALHPAVLHLIAQAANGAAVYRRWLGVCGGIASEATAAPILIGLGVTELSAAPAAIPALKAIVRTLRVAECRTLAERSLACGDAAEVRALIGGAR